MTSKARQYTIRNVPPRVDRALRSKAAERGLSLNALVLAALEAEAHRKAARGQKGAGALIPRR